MSQDDPAIANNAIDASASPGRTWWTQVATKPNIILLSSTTLLLVWKYFGTSEFYADTLADTVAFGHPDALAAFYQFGSCFVLLGVVPALIIKLIFREQLSDYGMGLGKRLFTVRSFLVAAPVIVIIGYLAAFDQGMRDAYPVNKQAGITTPFALHVGTYFLFYLAWEFHFRGFLQLGLASSIGRSQALLVQVMASSLLHIGHPFTETIASIIAGILWGYLAYRTNSIMSGMMQHLLIGVVVDAVIVFA